MLTSPAGTCSNRRGRTGFTLLEIILVVFIISLLAALVMPSFSGPGTGELKTDAKKLASLLRYLNDSAIYTKKTYDLTFDFREKTLSWTSPDGNKSQDLAKTTSVSLPSKGVVREGQVTVYFSPLGLQENIEISLSDAGEELKVSMNSLSGRVRIAGSGQ